MWTWMGLFLRKSCPFKMLRLTCSSKLDWGCYIVSVAKTASKKWNLDPFCEVFFSWGCSVSLQIYHTFMHGILLSRLGWCPLELLDKPQKWICRTVNPSLATSLEPLAHCRNVASLSFFYGFYFGRCSSELAQLVLLPFSQLRSTCYSDRLHDSSVTIPRCYNDVYVNIFFSHTARFWNSLSIECFPLTLI